MGTSPITKTLSAPLERQIRMLRFEDPAVEAAFRRDYAELSRAHLRVVMSVIVVIPTASLMGNALRGGVSASQWGVDLFSFALNVTALVITWWSAFPRVMQPLMGFLFLFEYLRGMFQLLPAVDPSGMLATASVVAFTLFRLRFRASVVVYWALLGCYLVYGLLVLHDPNGVVSRGLVSLAFANFMGMLAGYTLEQSSRRSFLLARLLDEERRKSEGLLLNILPERIAARLKERPGTVAEVLPDVTVLFADLVDFTPLCAGRRAEQPVELLNEVFSRFDRLTEKHGLEKIKTVGDAYMAVGGLRDGDGDHAAAAVALALDMHAEMRRLEHVLGSHLSLRAGIHTGPAVGGVIGTRRLAYDLWGDTVNLASRMESHGLDGEVQVSRATYERVAHLYPFRERHLADVKGLGPMTTYLLAPAAIPEEAGAGADSARARPDES